MPICDTRPCFSTLIEIRRVDDREDRIGAIRIGQTAEDDVDRDAFFVGVRAQSVRTGEIDEFHVTVAHHQRAGVALDGYAGIVADPLAESGQTVEKGALPRIGGANHRDAGIGLPARGDLGWLDPDFFRLVQRRPTWRPGSDAPVRA